jgi:hypothetical protein
MKIIIGLSHVHIAFLPFRHLLEVTTPAMLKWAIPFWMGSVLGGREIATKVQQAMDGFRKGCWPAYLEARIIFPHAGAFNKYFTKALRRSYRDIRVAIEKGSRNVPNNK